ncbi:class I SAM-dependent methyltransferase [Pseudomonas sp. B21-041]|uniref:Class I SAM-dependent methyltransferase n=1 Tax=Pseudomonas germanica TaxID=2815720 RepID=A0ABX8YWX2_9PSED|nr:MULTISPECIES: class I SAM-dependent methyltransferase [Pseudomonas]QYY84544.1 class I SAM-dependent methyltransferase [Pseudomonas germanica]UVL37186.1 class I SAM-dependent methyltransferase [Pseudomonas sp. B21-041]WPN77182.1 class I SAM-dependent methyltransferase [Pseudomonas germanica]
MSNAWNEGYFTDEGYTYSYSREINPVFQRYCLLLRGFAGLDNPDGYHCELGFGQGVSINIHATANPGGFVGTDFHPGQAAHAIELAELSNNGAKLYDDSFEQLLARHDLPQFDSISLHGIWTWVSRDNQKLIVEFARRHLKPGGHLYVSYNAFPGWSPAAPLRQLFSLHDRFANHSTRADQRIDAALQFSEALLAANPKYAIAAPSLGARLQTIKGQDRQYVAHEYFNRDWNCMYFADMVDALAPAKLDYVTTAVPMDSVDALNLSAEGLAFLDGIEHPVMREQARDYFVNQAFRRDLYVRGANRLSATERRSRMLNTRFVLMQPTENVASSVTGPAGAATLQAEIYRPLLNALADQMYEAKTMQQLLDAVSPMAYDDLEQAIAILVSMGAVAPCQSEAAEALVYERCAAFNLQLCKRALFNADIQVLSSPVTGGGVTVSRFQQLFLIAIRQGKQHPAEWAQLAWSVIAEQNEVLVKDGKALTTAEANIAALTEQAQAFAEQSLIVLSALKIV